MFPLDDHATYIGMLLVLERERMKKILTEAAIGDPASKPRHQGRVCGDVVAPE
jgi:hypothetical protein